MKLASLAQGRDNNFNLIRFLAAFAVLLSHSFPLATGIWDAEPLRKTLDVTLGSIAVDAFFITSGFLVAGSLMARNSVLGFALARGLRIYPALIIMVLSTAILGAAFTTLPVQEYFAAKEFWRYLLKNMSLVSGLSNELPGVFEQNPIKAAVNGSLWTLTYEVKMYIILAGLWAVVKLLPLQNTLAFKYVLAVCAIGSAVVYLSEPVNSGAKGWEFARLFYLFFSGAAAYTFRDKISLSGIVFVCLIAILILSGLDKRLFGLVYALGLAYMLLFLAYIPSGVIRKFNRLGDYSYGIYIYAFPVQQAVVASLPGVSVAMLFALSGSITLILAILSWHFLERRVLQLKDAATGAIMSVVGGLYKLSIAQSRGRD